MRRFHINFEGRKFLNKQSTFRWFETAQLSCDVDVMGKYTRALTNHHKRDTSKDYYDHFLFAINFLEETMKIITIRVQ